MLTLFFTILSLLQAAHAEIPLTPINGQYEIKGEYQYLSTGANYNSNGNSTSLVGGAKYVNMQGIGQFTYDLLPQWRAYAGASIGQTTTDVLRYPTTTSLATESRSSTGFNEIWVGGQYWKLLGNFDLVPQVDFAYPLFRADYASNDPLVGEGATKFQLGSWLMYHWGQFTTYVYGAYAYRDEGRSALLPYRAGLRYEIENVWWIEGEVRGYERMDDDSNTNSRTARELYLTRSNGGSFQYDSINPQQREFAFMGGMFFDPIGVYAGFANTFAGRNSADSWTATVGLTFYGAIDPELIRPERFKSRRVKYDDSLFEEQVVPPPAPPAQRVTPARSRPKPPPAAAAESEPAPPKRKRPSNEPMPSVELMMKDTQKSLEKKGQ